jgi:hypothetical protein
MKTRLVDAAGLVIYPRDDLHGHSVWSTQDGDLIHSHTHRTIEVASIMWQLLDPEELPGVAVNGMPPSKFSVVTWEDPWLSYMSASKLVQRAARRVLEGRV